MNLKAGQGLSYDHNVAVKSDVVHRRHSYFPKTLHKSRSPAYPRRQEKRRVKNNYTEACADKKHTVDIDNTAGIAVTNCED